MRGTPGLCIPWGSHQVLRPARRALIYLIFLPKGLGAKKPLQPAEAETGSRAQSQRPAKHPPSARTRRRPPLEQLGREPGHSRTSPTTSQCRLCGQLGGLVTALPGHHLQQQRREKVRDREGTGQEGGGQDPGTERLFAPSKEELLRGQESRR